MSQPSTSVLHYLQEWLPLSAQFVHGAVARSRHRTMVVARDPLTNRDAFPVPRVRALPRALGRAPARLGPAPVTLGLLAAERAFRADVVHVHFGYVVDDVVGLVRRRALPLSLALHGHDVTALLRDDPSHYDRAAPLVDAVVVPSRWLAERLDGAIARRRVEVVPAGVDLRRFRPQPPPPSGPPTAAFVGRFVPKKGLDVLAEAWPAVRTAVPDARLLVLGDGPLRPLVTDLAAHGVVPVPPDPRRRAEQVADTIAAAHVVVSPSHTGPDGDAESLLLVNLEAQASGRAVVTTDHGGIPEFVAAGRTALVVPERASGPLADALVTVLRDPDLGARLGTAGAEWARRFDVDACTARLDDLFAELAGG